MGRIKLIWELAFMMVLTGCVETIVLDPGEKGLPVMVNCLLTPDSNVQTLYLQYVKGKSANEYIPITDATVYVTAVFVSRLDTLHFHYIDENRWESEDNPLKRITGGKHYKLTIEIPGRDVIQAETTSPVAYRPYPYTDLHEVHSMDYHKPSLRSFRSRPEGLHSSPLPAGGTRAYSVFRALHTGMVLTPVPKPAGPGPSSISFSFAVNDNNEGATSYP